MEGIIAQLQQGSTPPNSPNTKTVKEIYDLVSARIASGDYVCGSSYNGETIETVVTKLATDRLFDASSEIKNALDDAVRKQVETGGGRLLH